MADDSASDTSSGGFPLEPSEEDMRAMGEAALSYVVRFIQELPDADASDLEGAEELARKLREEGVESCRAFDEVLELVERAAAKGFNTTGPGYLAYVPGGGLFTAALADFLATATNRFVNVWLAAPAFAQMEASVLRWLCDEFSYPAEARGVLTSGGSLSNFSAIVTARRSLLGDDFLKGTLYVSEQIHHSVVRAAVLAGFPPANIRVVRCTSELRLDVDALIETLDKDRESALEPFCVVASAGTTNTGAVDDLASLADVAGRERLWLHVDAAYGGFFQLTERGRRLFRGIERSDSITLDPHKAMFLPYGTGALLVRNGSLLRAAHSATGDASYLQDLAPEAEIPNFSEYSPELSRDFRGLRVWLPLKLHGAEAFRSALDEKLDLARFLYESLRDSPGFEVPWEPELTVVPFRYRPASGEPDEFNRRLLDRINASKRVFLSSTSIEGRFTLRACIVSHRTHRDRVEEAIGIIRAAARDLDAQRLPRSEV